MKKMIITAAAVAMFAAPAMASKARLSALSSAVHLLDTTDITFEPHSATRGAWAALEFGDAAGTTNPNAEGGFTKISDNTAWGFYLGSNSQFSTGRALSASLPKEQNPFDIVYAVKGDLSWGVGLHMSSTDNKTGVTAGTTNLKGSNNTLNFSAAQGQWDAHANLGLVDTASSTTAAVETKFTGTSGLNLGGGYWMDSMYLFANMFSGGGKLEAGGTETNKATQSVNKIGAVNTSKVEGGEFFYGATYLMDSSKTSPAGVEAKTDLTALNVIVGMEVEATSWLNLRGSLTQDVLVSSTKGATNTDSPRADNTTVAAGAGIKFGKMTLDGTLAGATTGAVNGNSLLAQSSLTYRW